MTTSVVEPVIGRGKKRRKGHRDSEQSGVASLDTCCHSGLNIKLAHPIITDRHLQEHVQPPYRVPCTFRGLSPVCSSASPSSMLFTGSCLTLQTFLLCVPVSARSTLPLVTWMLPTCTWKWSVCLLWKLSLTGLGTRNIPYVAAPQRLLHYI